MEGTCREQRQTTDAEKEAERVDSNRHSHYWLVIWYLSMQYLSM